MSHKISSIIKNLSIIFSIFLVLIFVLNASALTITPDNQFIVENETYTVHQNMDFHTLLIGPSYIIFNTTGFYISSGNDISITLVHLSDNIYYAGDGDMVLEFYADTTGGSVSFSISGFTSGNDYIVKRSGSTIGTFTANASGYISFINSVWSEHLFEIFQEGEGVVNNPPVVSNIPGQTISIGESFNQIELDDYVYDVEDPDEDIDWSYSGNTDLIVSIANRVVTISVPSSDWYGTETITFIAEDTGGLTDSDGATFTVVYNPPPPPPPPTPPPPSPPVPPPPSGNEDNNPPKIPLKPSGPTFVEMEIVYTYTSSTYDIDGDQIRYKFDWGDGYFSDWSDFVDSNTTVSRSYYWSSISTFAVRVIAQDIYGLNSSWSPALYVTVSQVGLGIPPVVVISLSGDNSVNGTIVFDASSSYDPDGFIVSYDWDFGDGEVASGINTSHVYKQSGDYTLTLEVTDNNGATYSKSIIINVISEVEELESRAQRVVPLFNFPLLIFGFAIAVLAFLAIFFRSHVTLFVSSHIIHPILNMVLSYRKHKIQNLDAKINEIYGGMEKMSAHKTVSTQLPFVKVERHYDEIQESYIRADSEVESTGEEKKSFDEFDKFYTNEMVEKFVKPDLKPDRLSFEEFDRTSFKDLDVKVTGDKLISTAFMQRSSKFDSESESMFTEYRAESIEKKVDHLLYSITRNKIDSLLYDN